jgi:hypothetical protein
MRRSGVGVLAALLVVVAIALAATLGAVRSWLHAPIDGLSSSRIVVVAPGQPLPAIARALARDGLIVMPRVCGDCIPKRPSGPDSRCTVVPS